MGTMDYLLRCGLSRITIIILYSCGHYPLMASLEASSRITVQHLNRTWDSHLFEVPLSTHPKSAPDTMKVEGSQEEYKSDLLKRRKRRGSSESGNIGLQLAYYIGEENSKVVCLSDIFLYVKTMKSNGFSRSTCQYYTYLANKIRVCESQNNWASEYAMRCYYNSHRVTTPLLPKTLPYIPPYWSVTLDQDEDLSIPLTYGESISPNVLWQMAPPIHWRSWKEATIEKSYKGGHLLRIDRREPGLYVILKREYSKPRDRTLTLHVIRRNRYGNPNCPACSHGGQCHDTRGTCICPPGFYGVECQHQCPEGFIGKNCNFPLSHVKPNTKNAKGILLCAEEPFGCTCGAGYFGARCEKECSNGKWGPNCNLNCDCKDGKCNKYNGTCLTSTQNPSGSTDDYSTTTEEPQSNNGIIIGVIFALLFLIVAALICVYFRENIRKYIYLGKQSLLLGDIKTIPQEPEDCPWLEDSGVPECTGENLELCITSEQIEVSLSMAEYSFETEEWFKSVPRKFNKSITAALLPENIMKNRYKGIVPYDDKRVVLSKLPGDDFSDYINASYITTKYSKKFYIATQGPKDFNVNTIADFWRMVWEVNCPAIVMVARLMENGKVKVAKYWPDINGTMKLINGIQVKALAVETKMKYHIRSFMMTFQGTSRNVTQYHYEAWPDHGVPITAYSLSHMVMTLRKDHSNPKGPIVVHCSAGIGRTGTVLYVLIVLDQLEKLGYISPCETLTYLRQGRAFLVENVEQFRFAHATLGEFLFGSSYSIPCEQYASKFKEMRTLDSNGTYPLAEQYNKLKSVPVGLTFHLASNPIIANMNRSMDILPADSRSVFLQILDGQPENQYINAVKVNGFEKQDKYIATEHPLPHTLHSFWRMVYEKNASLVVLLTNIEDENFIPLIPSLSDQRDWKVHVHVKNSQTFTYFKEVNVSVISKSSGLYSHEVQLVIFTAWPLGCTIPTPNAFLTMLEYIQALKKPKPILLCCPDGVTGCGLTAAFLNILAKVQQMEEVDIYHAVQTILHDRPQFINHLTQLEFLYDASLEYIQNHSIYNNFYRV